MTDLWLAIAHHVLVFGLVAMLAAESTLIRPGMTAAEIRRAAGLDAGYGATATLIIIVGVLRVIYGLKGPDYYLDNHWFWAKMGTFALIGILSVPPTVTLIGWRKALRDNAGFVPAPDAIGRVRRYIRIELILVVAVVAFAAAMARYTRA
jgi:putative membrane protein